MKENEKKVGMKKDEKWKGWKWKGWKRNESRESTFINICFFLIPCISNISKILRKYKNEEIHNIKRIET
jgi:hypothetical protein